MSALTTKQQAIIALTAEAYGIPIMYALRNYGSTSRKMKSANSRKPDWTFNAMREVREILDEAQGAKDFVDGYESVLWSMTGNWGALALSALDIDGYNDDIRELHSLTVRYAGMQSGTERGSVMNQCVAFLADALEGNLKPVTPSDIKAYINRPKPVRDPRFPEFSTSMGELRELSAIHAELVSATDNTLLMKYLDRDQLFYSTAFDAIARNPTASHEVLERVLVLMEAMRMDYTNTPEADYYRAVREITAMILARVEPLRKQKAVDDLRAARELVMLHCGTAQVDCLKASILLKPCLP
jgi:hypothetical protein